MVRESVYMAIDGISDTTQENAGSKQMPMFIPGLPIPRLGQTIKRDPDEAFQNAIGSIMLLNYQVFNPVAAENDDFKDL